jgi:hypothetical protein
VSGPSNLLNPLHPSITPFGKISDVVLPEPDRTLPTKKGPKARKRRGKDSKRGPSKNSFIIKFDNTSRRKIPNGNATKATTPSPPLQILPSIDLSLPENTETKVLDDGSRVVYPRDAKTGKTILISVSEIGKASNIFGHKPCGEEGKCNVFEVVSQTKEVTMCPSCARSPKRARLPAHARGCFGLS